jgi:hypothetical protein
MKFTVQQHGVVRVSIDSTVASLSKAQFLTSRVSKRAERLDAVRKTVRAAADLVSIWSMQEQAPAAQAATLFAIRHALLDAWYSLESECRLLSVPALPPASDLKVAVAGPSVRRLLEDAMDALMPALDLLRPMTLAQLSEDVAGSQPTEPKRLHGEES